MFDVPGSNIRGVYVDENVVLGKQKAQYVTGPIETTERSEDTNESFPVEEEHGGTRTML